MILAESHNWTPDEVDALDPDFVAELFAYKQARADHEAVLADLTPEQREKRSKVAVIKRKVAMMKRRQPEDQTNGSR